MPGNDRIYSSGFDIRHNGSPLGDDAAWRIEEISVEDELDAPAMFRITVNCTDFTTMSWKDINLETFNLGDEIKISMGINQNVAMMTGEITSLEPQFGESCTMEIRGFDRMHKLRFGTFRRSFAEMTDSDIVSSIVQEAGLTVKADSTSTVHPYVFQNNISNYEFLRRRASECGFEIMVDNKTFVFRQSQESSSPVVTLEYGLDLERLSISMKALTEGSSVEVRGWDVLNKTEISASATSGNELSLMKGSKSGFAMSGQAFSDSATVLSSTPVVDASHAETIAKAVYNARLREFLSAEGSTNGNPGIRAGKTIEIKGLGTKFSGVYYVVSSTHTISSRDGYSTTFKLRRTAV